jgi:hypothetical protein
MNAKKLLPIVDSFEEYRRLYRDPQVWLPAMRVICERHGLDAATLEQSPAGTHVVFSAGPRTSLKLFVSFWREDVVPEKIMIDHPSRPEVDWPKSV